MAHIYPAVRRQRAKLKQHKKKVSGKHSHKGSHAKRISRRMRKKL